MYDHNYMHKVSSICGWSETKQVAVSQQRPKKKKEGSEFEIKKKGTLKRAPFFLQLLKANLKTCAQIKSQQIEV